MEKAGTDPFSECRQVLRRRIPVSGRDIMLQDQHGFARDYELEGEASGQDFVTHRFVSNAETREVLFQFDFKLLITHRLLVIRWMCSGR